jgi:hypothetical protein
VIQYGGILPRVEKQTVCVWCLKLVDLSEYLANEHCHESCHIEHAAKYIFPDPED